MMMVVIIGKYRDGDFEDLERGWEVGWVEV